jgi:DNA-binding transcriptional LysR family regulator
MNLALIKSFSVLGEVCHFGEAAKRLQISQPSLTKQILRLEDLLGAQLFHRTRQGTELTAFGRQFLTEVQPVIRHADSAWEYGLQGARGERGLIAFGFTFSAVEVMTDLVIAYRGKYPKVELTFNDISSRVQVSMIEDRRLDIGFIRLPIDADLASITVARDRLAFVYPAKMADQIDNLDSKVVRDLPFIGLQIGKAPGTETYIQRLLASRNRQPKTVHRVNESLTQLTLISAGLGYSLMHESALSRVIDHGGGVIVQPIEDPLASWEVGLVWRHEEPNPAVAQFVKMAHEMLPG